MIVLYLRFCLIKGDHITVRVRFLLYTRRKLTLKTSGIHLTQLTEFWII